MPSWTDDEGRCHYSVNGVPCYRSTTGKCPAHGGMTRVRGEDATTILRVEALADDLYAALKDYYHKCKCQRTEMDAVNQAAYAALRKYENWSGK